MASTDYLTASANVLATAVRRRDISARELLDLYLRRIEEINPSLNAIVTLNPHGRAAAADADASFARKHALGPLHGVPFTVKDTLVTAGLRTTAGSRLLADNVPVATATAVRRLTEAGAILLGKTNCSEFAVETHAGNPLFGDTWNPWDERLSPGGSTGGDSCAVAAGMSAFCVGTDFGGSIRWPAHCTGTVALRPTIGLVRETGVLPYLPADQLSPPNSMSVLHRLGTVGVITRAVEDLGLLLEVMAGPDGMDSQVAPVPLQRPDRTTLPGLSCAWFDCDGTVPVRQDLVHVVRQAVAVLAASGMTVTQARPPGLETAAGLFKELRAAEGMPEVRELASGRADEMGSAFRDHLLGSPPEGTSVEAYRRVAGRRDALRAQVLGFMRDFPILVLPVACVPASDPATVSFSIEGVDVAWSEIGSSCRAISVLGAPVVVVPCGTSTEGLPVAVQIVARPFHDHEALAVAMELAAAFRRPQPPTALRSTAAKTQLDQS